MSTNILPEKFKKDWVAALRSGKYEQGTGELYNVDHNRFCCIGVAAVVAGINRSELTIAGYLDGSGPSGLDQKELEKTPLALRGDNFDNPIVSILTKMNDDYHNTFDQIADYIETHL